jgi:hypothetical protein
MWKGSTLIVPIVYVRQMRGRRKQRGHVLQVIIPQLGKADLPHTPLSIKISKRLERQPILRINILVSKLRYLH